MIIGSKRTEMDLNYIIFSKSLALFGKYKVNQKIEKNERKKIKSSTLADPKCSWVYIAILSVTFSSIPFEPSSKCPRIIEI